MEEYEKIYADEFAHLVFDLGEKVTITNISDKYERSVEEISQALSKWAESQKGKVLKKEYIVRGKHVDGYPLITVVAEEKLERAKNAVKDAYILLYSVETPSTGNSMDLGSLSAVKFKNLYLPSESIQNKEHIKKDEIAASTSHETVKVKSPAKPKTDFFNNTKKAKSSSEDTESSRNGIKIEKPVISPKVSKTESSPPKKPAIKNSQVANANKKSPVKGKADKNSIARFFGSNCTATNGKPDAPVPKFKEEVKTPSKKRATNGSSEKQKSDTIKVETTTRKRPLDKSDTKKEKEPKKPKVLATGRKRIYVHSSDEENMETGVQERSVSEDEIPVQPLQTKKDIEVQDLKKEVPEEEKETPASFICEDDDGFLVTVKDTKQISKKTITQKPSVVRNLTKLDKVPVKAATKQGSIRSFFIKK